MKHIKDELNEKKDFKIFDNILAFRPWREPSVPAALNAPSAIQSDFYLGRKETCWAMNEKVSLDKYVKYLLNLSKRSETLKSKLLCPHFFQKPNEKLV